MHAGSVGDPSNPITTSLDFSSEQDKIYFTVEIGAQNPDTLTIANYNNNFTVPIVNDPEEYYCTVKRFSCPAGELPVFIPEFQSGSFTNTIYSVTLTYNGNVNRAFVQYSPTSGYPTSSEFYSYVHNYQDFLTMINAAISSAFGSIAPPVGATAPYFQYDPTTSLISLVAQRTFYDETVPLPIRVYLNQPLAVLLSGLDMQNAPFGSIPDSQGRDALIRIRDTKNNWYQPSWAPVVSPPNYYQILQNYPSVVSWSPVKSVRLVSNTIPIKREYVVAQNLDTQLSGLGVLQTFIPLYNENSGHATAINYVPTQYQLLNMAGHKPIQQIDFQFQWIDGDGIARNVYIPYNAVCSVSFGFLKKNTFTS